MHFCAYVSSREHARESVCVCARSEREKGERVRKASARRSLLQHKVLDVTEFSKHIKFSKFVVH